MCIGLTLTSQSWPTPSAAASVYATCRHRWQGTCSRVILTCSGSSSQPFGIAGGAAKLRGLVGQWPLVNGSKWWWLRFNKSYQQINGGLLLKPLVFWPISLAWAYPWCESCVGQMSPQCHMARLRTILLLKSFPNECVLMSVHMCCGNPKVRAQKEANQMCLKLQGSRSHCHGDDGCPLPSKGFQSL